MRRLRVYLAGPIADVKDNSYILWRQDLRKFLETLKIEALDPTDKYQGHCGDVRDELSKLRKEGKLEDIKKFMEEVVLPIDRKLVKKADVIIAYMPEYTVGTCREIALAYEWKKPIYVVTPIRFPSYSLIGMATKIFSTFEGLKDYLYLIWKNKA